MGPMYCILYCGLCPHLRNEWLSESTWSREAINKAYQERVAHVHGPDKAYQAGVARRKKLKGVNSKQWHEASCIRKIN